MFAVAATSSPVNATCCSTRRHRLERRRHAVAVSVATTTLIVSIAGWTPSSTAAVTIMIIAVAVGMPHGALDVVVGPRLARPSVFFATYLALAAATALVWLIAPLLTVAIFLAASWFHFARGDADHHRELGTAGTLVGISTAGCALGLPLALHSGIVAPVLSDLLLGTATLSTEQITGVGTIITSASFVTGVVAGIAALQVRRYVIVTELVTIALVAAIVHPLVSFAIYFALWHSPRHMIALDVERRAVKPTLIATAATLLAGVLVWRLLDPSTAAATQVIFIGLAALTTPHLVVTERLRYRGAKQEVAH